MGSPQQLELILAARDEMTPVLNGASRSVANLQIAVKAYGTATPAAKVATSQLLDTLRASRAATDSAAEGFGSVSEAAKHLAKGGLAEVLSQVPIVGNALSRLATGLGGFPLLAGGVIGAGIGIIKMLSDMDTAATKDLQGIEALSKSIGTDFRQAQLDAAQVTAEATNQRTAAIELGYQKELAASEAAKNQAIATAQAEFDEVNNRWFASLATRQIALAKYMAAKAAAEGKSADDAIAAQARENARILALLNEQIAAVQGFEQAKRSAQAAADSGALGAQGNTTQALQVSIAEQVALIKDGYAKQVETLRKLFGDDVQSFNEQRVVAEETMQAKLVALEQTAADQRRQILQQSTTAAIDIVAKLGTAFGSLGDKLKVAQFVQQTGEAIKQVRGLSDAIAAGDSTFAQLGITQKDLDDVMKQLGEDMQDAVTHGAIPLHETAQSLVTDFQELKPAAIDTGNALVDMWLKAARAAIQAEDAAKAAGAAMAGDTAASPFSAPSTTSAGTLVGAGNVDVSSLNPYGGIGSFDTGGVVPGPPGRPMLAWVHGGEEVVARDATAAYAGRGGGRPVHVVNIAPGAISISGTVIDQNRAWSALVETLGQALDSRAMRRR